MRTDWHRFSMNSHTYWESIYVYSTSHGGTKEHLYDYVSASVNNPNVWGYLYDGPDSDQFPLLDAAISICLRVGGGTTDTDNYSQPAGVFMRQQTLNPTSVADLQCYIAGSYEVNHRVTDPVPMRCYRRLGTSLTQIGSSWNVPLVQNWFIQFEMAVTNSEAGNPVIRTRHNAGVAFEQPGGPNWTGWVTVAEDTGAGVLAGEGHWGWGNHHYQNSTSGGKYLYWDDCRILKNPPSSYFG